MSSKILNFSALALSSFSLLVSIALDVKNRKTAGLMSSNGIIGLILRISLCLGVLLSVLVNIKGETYVTDNKSLAEKRIGVTFYLCGAQATVSLAIICLFATFTYYWVSVSALLPKSKLLGKVKILIDRYPLMIPIGIAVYYVIYLGFFFGPLLIWNGQLLRYSFWRALIQAIVQIILGLFLLPVLLYLVYSFVRYMAVKSIAQSGDNNFDKVTMALLRIMFTNVVLTCFLILAPATNLVLDRTLLFQEISLTHPIYSRPAMTMMSLPQGIMNLTGFFVSLIFLGKYITVKRRTTSTSSKGKTKEPSERSNAVVKASQDE
ncbi:hypothetical protein BC833DRAFT_662184 [Globomyces pollinis-pini]|nr:hypothetical protein BC833DRAFT_662184 [Globomyces pollinis-pini]